MYLKNGAFELISFIIRVYLQESKKLVESTGEENMKITAQKK